MSRSAICKGCGTEIRRIYSVASTDEDDYLAECECPPDWPVVLLQLVIISVFIGLMALGIYLK